MLENKEGQQIPEANFTVKDDQGLHPLSSKKVFDGKKVIAFSLPGAFTPTCSSTHLPRYEELHDVFRKHGVDDIVCISVNDAFVMEAWGQNQRAKNVKLLADGNGEFSEKMGLLVDKSNIGFGKRSWRYSMLVNDGKIEKMFIEPQKDGDPFEVSDAETMLNHIAPNAKKPAEVTIFSKPGCPFCKEAKELLQEKGFRFEEIELSGPVSYATLRAVTGESTAPQIYMDGLHIKGLSGLKKHFGL